VQPPVAEIAERAQQTLKVLQALRPEPYSLAAAVAARRPRPAGRSPEAPVTGRPAISPPDLRARNKNICRARATAMQRALGSTEMQFMHGTAVHPLLFAAFPLPLAVALSSSSHISHIRRRGGVQQRQHPAVATGFV
jgi:hypothetical protein